MQMLEHFQKIFRVKLMVQPKCSATLTQLHAAKQLTKKWVWHPFQLQVFIPSIMGCRLVIKAGDTPTFWSVFLSRIIVRVQTSAALHLGGTAEFCGKS